MPKKKIIAIGGGEIGRKGKKVETKKIDKEIIRLTGKKNPKLLFIPTASSDAEGYVETVKKHFGGRLGCKIDVLYLINTIPSKKEIQDKILSQDIIYVGGGNTLKMMRLWRKLGIDKMLKQAHNRGIVLSGLSAGSICWFRQGCSDSKKYNNKGDKTLIKVTGLGFIDTINCPHYDVEKHRQPAVKKMMKTAPGVTIALDNCASLEVIDNKYRIITSKKGANAHRIFWKGKKYHKEIIPAESELRPIDALLNKKKQLPS